MKNKIVIAKPGFNAISETDPNNLVFSSDYNTFKYDVSGNTEVTIPVSAGAYAGEFDIVTHSLGYNPVHTAYIKESGLERYYSLPYMASGFWGYIYFMLYSTSSKLIFRAELSSNASEFDMTIWYKVFKNKNE